MVVLGISEDEGPPEAVRAFVAEYRINYSIAMTTPELAKVFRGVSALPTTFVIDREGKVCPAACRACSTPQETELEAQVLAGLNTNVPNRTGRRSGPRAAGERRAGDVDSRRGPDEADAGATHRSDQGANADDCTCGCGLTLAECRINDPECSISLPLARAKVEKIAAASHRRAVESSTSPGNPSPSSAHGLTSSPPARIS